MKPDGENARGKLYRAVLELLGAGEDAGSITTRQIAAKAGVNLALVNYYYQSKENLLSEVVGKMMGDIIAPIFDNSSGEDAESRLRNILTATADAAFMHENICKIAIASELKHGCRNSCAMVMPLLREIFPTIGQEHLDITALQLMLPFHHIILEPELYGRILGTHFFNKQKRDIKINEMMMGVIKGVVQHS